MEIDLGPFERVKRELDRAMHAVAYAIQEAPECAVLLNYAIEEIGLALKNLETAKPILGPRGTDGPSGSGGG
jgi:hypothetical protein